MLQEQEIQELLSVAKSATHPSDVREEAIYKLGELYAGLGRANDIAQLVQDIRPFFLELPKAKTAKIVRSLLDCVKKIPNTVQLQIKMCQESIEWTKVEKRTFLRQRIQSRLAELYFQNKEYQPALSLINSLLREIRKLDDKNLLVEIQLLESEVHNALKSISKAKTALTAARSAATSIYCPPLLQAQLDIQSGILHAEEKDYKTAYSYFFESFEGFNSLDDPSAIRSLKYMLLCKIMTNAPEDINVILSGKNALKYSGVELDAMRAVAKAYQDRSLHAFEDTLRKYKTELSDDPIIESHLSDLYDNLLEQHLKRLIEPFARVQITHVASLIKLPVQTVERKLSQMILDKKLSGILDQGLGCLIVFEDKKENKMYPCAIETVGNMAKVVESLFERTGKLY